MLKLLSRRLEKHWFGMGAKIESMRLGRIVPKTEKKAYLAKLEAIDCGKPLEEAHSLHSRFCLIQEDVAGCFEYFADMAVAFDSKEKDPCFCSHGYVQAFRFERTPWGGWVDYAMVRAAAWFVELNINLEKDKMTRNVTSFLVIYRNYPMLMATWKVAPALAAGCRAILKPSELASITGLELAEVCRDVGLPSGVLNILTGFGPEAGAHLVSDPDVDN